MTLARIGDWLFRYRNLLFPLCLPVALLPGPQLFDNLLVAAALGFVIAATGEAVRVSTIGLQYIVRGGKDRRVYAKDLVTGGVYAHTRNPMYVGNMLILIGLAVASNSWTCVAVAVPFYAFVCAAIVAAEERYLQGRFGVDFDGYCHDVPRWLPRWSGLRATLADHSFNWQRVVLKEYGTPVGWTLAWGLLVFWNLTRSAGGTEAHHKAVIAVAGIVAAMLVFWIFARIVKKSNRWGNV